MMGVKGIMPQTAKILTNGHSHAERLPASFRLEGADVYIRRKEATGDVILSKQPEGWGGLLAAIKDGGVPDDFLGAEDRSQHEKDHDPFYWDYAMSA